MHMTIHTRLLPAIAVAAVLVYAGCSRNDTELPGSANTDEKTLPASSFEQDKVRIRVSGSLADSLEAGAGEAFLEALDMIGATDICRTFPYAGEFEGRHRKEGLHLWYDVHLDDRKPLSKAGDDIASIMGIEKVEYLRKTVSLGDRKAGSLFNDPDAGEQWHYFNEGDRPAMVAGIDINVLPVWENYTVGHSDVVVAVIDGGVDYNHEDLAANMWHNPNQSGENVYGCNFTRAEGSSERYVIHPEAHGTHVAGIIAAVNNNGKGISGIAGGDAARGIQGVKIMSCQIFDGDRSANGAEALVWAADHGAVIAQCSWGYEYASEQEALRDETPDDMKAAIDYFTKYAGTETDAEGNIIGQKGPMAGGIVIFAAGNDGWSIGHPADYDGCLAVGGIAADGQAAYYSNYGSWVDVAAPGGDERKGPQIYSTLPDNQYGLMQGTSMACPHVSGIAALAVSRYAQSGKTITAAELRERLEKGVRDISEWCSKDVGDGLTDAYLVVVGDDGLPPEKIGRFTVSGYADNAVVELSVPKDPDDGRAYEVVLYWSGQELTVDNITSAQSAVIRTWDYEAGKTIRDTVATGRFETTLYFAAVARDYGGRASAISDNVTWTTGANRPPVIEPLTPTDVEFKVFQTADIDFRVYDPDGHEISVSVDPAGSPAVMTSVGGDTVRLSIQGLKVPEAEKLFSGRLIATDSYGASSTAGYTYKVFRNTAPEAIGKISDMILTSTDPVRLKVNDYFSDSDGEPLTVTGSFSENGIVSLAVNESGEIVLTPLTAGSTDVTITASDAAGESASIQFRILVRLSESPVDLYPNPVSDVLYIRVPTDSDITVTVRSVSGAEAARIETTAGPFTPAEIDFTSIPGGVYTVTVTTGNTEHAATIVKL